MTNTIIADKQTWQMQKVESFIKNTASQNLEKFVTNLVNCGCVFKGQNKSEKDVKIITQVFINELKKRFKYLTTSQIKTAIENQNYGEYGITVEGLVKCIEKTYSFEEQKNNRLLEEYLQKEYQKQLAPPKEHLLSRKEKVDFLRKGFDFWKKRGYVADLTGEIWEYANEIAPNYEPSFSDKKKYILQAKQSAYEYFFEKNKFKYRLAIKVCKDKELLKSNEFKIVLRHQYKEMYLRDFFKRSKWNTNN